MDELECKIDGIVFSNITTGFYILKAYQDKNKISVKGTFPGIKIGVGTKARFKGGWDNHPTYGKQFSATSCEVIPEKGRNGVVTYLVNNVKSIGPITAGRLYGVFGEDLLKILDEEPDRILTVDFLTSTQSQAILKEWKQASENRTSAVFLVELGLNASQIKSVFTEFGTETIKIVKENPYKLYECFGVGFVTADNAARKLGVEKDDIRRICSIILFIMKELSFSEGHMYVTTDQIHKHCKHVFKKNALEPFSHGEYLSDSHYYNALDILKKSGKITSHDDKLYLAHNWIHEHTAADCISEFITQSPFPLGNLETILNEFEIQKKLIFSEEQRNALFLLNESRIAVISGYPGTGKTLLISAFVNLFENSNLNYVLLSPTGIAAKRLSQVTGKPASTIHRALGYKGDGTWEFSASNKYYVDAVIVDEMSMVDSETFYCLVSSLKPTTLLVLVGDAAQLPSVGAGQILKRLVECPEVPHVTLKKIYRQVNQSDIIKTAHAILCGEPVDVSYNDKSEFVFLPFEKEDVLKEICKITSMMKQREANFQVIAPMYDGNLGVNNLNIELRKVLNSDYSDPKIMKLKHGACDMYEGDRVMVIKNDYEKMIFNGDVGKVQRISIKNNEVEVKIFDWFDQESTYPKYIDKTFKFSLDEARFNLRVAFASTVHKCLSPDTLVETTFGIERICDIKDDGYISTPTGRAFYKNKVCVDDSPMVRITTKDGYTLEMTLDHGMNVWDKNDGLIRKEAQHLKIGDVLPLRLGKEFDQEHLVKLHESTVGHPNEIVYETPTQVDELFAEFLGLMVADGTIYHSGFRLVKSHAEVSNRFYELCKLLFNTEPQKVSVANAFGFEISSTYLSRWLLSINGLSPHHKHIPSVILRSGRKVIASFLRGLFEDGTVNVKHAVKADHIELSTKSKQLHDELKIVLLSFGIISGSGVRNKKLLSGEIRKYYVVYIYGENIKLFKDSIGFITKFKSDRLELEVGINRNYQIPVLKSEITEIRNENGGPKFFDNTDKNSLIRFRISRGQLDKLLHKSKAGTKIYDKLKSRMNFHFSKIAKIEMFHGKSVCVEVPDGNQFIQNGFCGWNCQGQEYDFVILPMTMQYGIMLYRNLIYTAITRAKKKVFVFGDPNAFSFAVSNNRDVVRNSALDDYIRMFLKKETESLS